MLGTLMFLLVSSSPVLGQTVELGQLVEDSVPAAAVSGRTGDRSRVWPTGTTAGLRGIDWWEREDNPCRVQVTTQRVSADGLDTMTLDLCHDNAYGNRRSVQLGPRSEHDPAWGFFVTRVRVCMNRASVVGSARRGRLIKGIRIQGSVFLPWGESLSDYTETPVLWDVAKGNNCLDDDSVAWEPWVGCAPDASAPNAPRFATRLVVHYEEDSSWRRSPRITGLSLRCATLKPRSPRRMLTIGSPDSTARWAGLPARDGIPGFFRQFVGFDPGNGTPRALDTVAWQETVPGAGDPNRPCAIGVIGKNLNVPWNLAYVETGRNACGQEPIDSEPSVAGYGNPTYFGWGGSGQRQLPANAFITGLRVCRSTLPGRQNEIKGIRLDGATIDENGRVSPLSGSSTIYQPSEELPACVGDDLDLPHEISENIGLSSRCGTDPKTGALKIATGLNLHFAETALHPATGLPIEPAALVGVQLVCSTVRALPPTMSTVAADPAPREGKRPVVPRAKPAPDPTKSPPKRPVGTAKADLRYGWRLGERLPFDPEDLQGIMAVGSRGGDWGGPDLDCPVGQLLTGIRINVELRQTVNRMVGIVAFCSEVTEDDPTGLLFAAPAEADLALPWGEIDYGSFNRVGPREVIVAFSGAAGTGSLKQLGDYGTVTFATATPANPAVSSSYREIAVEGAVALTGGIFSPSSYKRAQCSAGGSGGTTSQTVVRGLRLHRNGSWISGVTLLCQELDRVRIGGPVPRLR